MKVHLLKALRADPMFSEAHFQLAIMYQEEGYNKEAETHFRKAIESDSQDTCELEKNGKESNFI